MGYGICSSPLIHSDVCEKLLLLYTNKMNLKRKDVTCVYCHLWSKEQFTEKVNSVPIRVEVSVHKTPFEFQESKNGNIDIWP